MDIRRKIEFIINRYNLKRDSVLEDWNYILSNYSYSGYINEPCLEMGIYSVGYYVYEKFGSEYNFIIRYLNGSKIKLQLYYPLFGFSLFSGYSGDPIILVEGVSDLFYIRSYYPYVLACLTSSLSYEQLFFIKSLTDYVILAFDNDLAGRKGTEIAINRLEYVGVKYNYMFSKFKDWGDYIKNGIFDDELLRNRIKDFLLCRC